MKEIPLFGENDNGRTALVDDEYYALISRHRWYVWERLDEGQRPNGPYAHMRFGGSGRSSGGIFMHTLITGYPITDHIDHNGLNNQWSNLRLVTVAENNHNRRSRTGSSSRFKGVYWNRRARKWQASLGANGKQRYLGVFTSEEDAALAYNAAALEAFGEYACLNEVATVSARDEITEREVA